MEIAEARNIVFKVYWKNWLGEWVTNEKVYKTQKAADTFARSIAKQAENGVTSVRNFTK